MSRWRAAGIHLLISVGVSLVALTLMLTLWYPRPYFEAIGADGLLMILVGVDIVMGPLITLIIFKAGKKGLKFDLAVIGALQLCALIYGFTMVFLVRPAFVVFSVDRFEVVQAVDMDMRDPLYPQFAELPLAGPKWAAVKRPDSPQEQQSVMFESLFGGKDYPQYAKYLQPYENAAKQAAGRSRPVSTLSGRYPEAESQIQSLLAEHGRGEEDVGYLPLKAHRRDMSVMVDKRDGEVLGILPLDPW